MAKRKQRRGSKFLNMKIKFFKNNKTDGEYNVKVTMLSNEFWNSSWGEAEMPLQRAFLGFLSDRSDGSDTWELTKDELELVLDEVSKSRPNYETGIYIDITHAFYHDIEKLENYLIEDDYSNCWVFKVHTPLKGYDRVYISTENVEKENVILLKQYLSNEGWKWVDTKTDEDWNNFEK